MTESQSVRLVLFAAAREAAGRSNDSFPLCSLDDLLLAAQSRYGEEFSRVLAISRVWVNGEEPGLNTSALLRDGDEVAVLPPVSGG